MPPNALQVQEKIKQLLHGQDRMHHVEPVAHPEASEGSTASIAAPQDQPQEALDAASSVEGRTETPTNPSQVTEDEAPPTELSPKFKGKARAEPTRADGQNEEPQSSEAVHTDDAPLDREAPLPGSTEAAAESDNTKVDKKETQLPVEPVTSGAPPAPASTTVEEELDAEMENIDLN